MLEKTVSFSWKNSPHKERGVCVVIPNIPKLVDERGRIKLLCDYEKYEAELFKHHIGTPDTTRTIGLKQFPEDFDRRVPSLNEPTIAERDWEARKNCRKSLRQSLTTLDLRAQVPKRGVANVQAAHVAQAAQAAQVVNEAGQIALAGDSQLTASILPSLAENLSQPTLPQQRQRKRQQRDVKETAKAPPQEAQMPSPPQATPGLLPQAVVKPKVQGSASNAEGKTETGQQVMMSGRSQSRKMDFSLRLPVFERKITSSRGGRGNSPISIPQPNVCISGDISPGSPYKDCGGKWDAAYCGRLVYILLDTPFEYSESFKLDLRNIDLKWMLKNRYPNNFVSLHTWREKEDSDVVPTINSPRSVIVLLRNGVVVRDLIPDASIVDASLPQDPEARHIAKSMRLARRAKRCELLLQKLRSEYGELCRQTSLADLLAEFHALRKGTKTLELPTTIKLDSDRQQRIFEIERKRLEKRMAFAKDMHERQLAAEKRQKQLEVDALLKAALKKEEDRIARERVAERLAAQEQKKAELEAFYMRELQERQSRADELQARRAEAQQRLKELRRERCRLHAEKRQQRRERVAEKQEENRQEVLKKYAMKEAQLQRLQEKQRQWVEGLRAKIAAKNARSKELRELALQKAAEHEEKLYHTLLEQQQRSESRCLQFQEKREEARAKRAQQKEIKNAQREKVFKEAIEKLNSLKEKVLEKRMEHDKKLEELHRQQELELLVRSEQHTEGMEQKAFAVQRKKRMVEFNKLGAVLRLLSKRDAADLLEKQRKLLLDEMRKTREAMELSVDAMKEEIVRRLESLEQV